jgi:hypothetical protein
VNARAAGTVVSVVINLALGLAFVYCGAAAWLWQRVERDVPWRTGPTALGVLAYFAIYWGAWILVNLAIERRVSDVVAYAGTAMVASCGIVAMQVLVSPAWLVVVLTVLLIACLLNAYIVREPLRRAITAWAWSGAGVALATLLIHPWFVGQPLFVVRLAMVMTVWDWLGEWIGVTPRLMRFVPSLYSASSSWIAAQERVAR